MTKLAAALPAALLLSACASEIPAGRTPMAGRVPTTYGTQGLERVMGQNAAGLVSMFGTPDADFREGAARKLQFRGPACVLDAYLYPEDGREPRVTWVDARRPDGTPIDRASCAAALARR